MSVYALETITNLHVGDMGAAFSVVDKTVQRDALTTYPTIYASSIKGAVRCAAENRFQDAAGKQWIRNVFGGEKDDISKGTVSFNDARLLFFPVRSVDRPYYLATCPAMLRDCEKLMRLCGYDALADKLKELSEMNTNIAYVWTGGNNKVLVEEWKLSKAREDNVTQLLGCFVDGEEGFVLLSNANMKELLEALPVVARNQLDNGISVNLWYEEFVPRKTVFLLGLIGDTLSEINWKKLFSTPIQIGANATVGYGLCRFKRLGEEA